MTFRHEMQSKATPYRHKPAMFVMQKANHKRNMKHLLRSMHLKVLNKNHSMIKEGTASNGDFTHTPTGDHVLRQFARRCEITSNLTQGV